MSRLTPDEEGELLALRSWAPRTKSQEERFQHLQRRWVRNNRAENMQPEPAKRPLVVGIGRVADNPMALIVYFEWEPSDDDLRAVHEMLVGRL